VVVRQVAPADNAVQYQDLEEVSTMLEQTVDGWVRRWKRDAQRSGHKQGLKDGRQEGLEEGRQEDVTRFQVGTVDRQGHHAVAGLRLRMRDQRDEFVERMLHDLLWQMVDDSTVKSVLSRECE